MYNSIIQFKTNIGYVRNLSTIYYSLKSLAANADLSDILRAQLLMSVSAMDHFVHNSIEEGMLEIYQGSRPPTMSFNDFTVKMKDHQFALVNTGNTSWLRVEIQGQIGHNSYQKSKNIAKGVRLISDRDLWVDVGSIVHERPDIIARKLDLIVTRRNTIVHQADNDPSNPGQRLNITESEISDAIDLIEKLGDAIFQVIR